MVNIFRMILIGDIVIAMLGAYYHFNDNVILFVLCSALIAGVGIIQNPKGRDNEK